MSNKPLKMEAAAALLQTLLGGLRGNGMWKLVRKEPLLYEQGCAHMVEHTGNGELYLIVIEPASERVGKEK